MHRILLSAGLFCACAPSLFAQGIVTATIGSGPGRSTPTVGSPVTLVLEDKTVQTLPDGTHITRVVRETFYRDSQGRTRQENEFPRQFSQAVLSPHSVMVNDPATGSSLTWIVGPGAGKEYTRFGIPASMVGTVMSPPPPPPVRPAAASQGTAPGGMMGFAGGSTASAPDEQHRPKTTREDLGEIDVQGFPCRLTRRTTTYPEGYLGNDRPITRVDESCLSQEFGRAIQNHVTDPRSGEQTLTVISISRSEPDASLFQPPPDYTERVQNRP